ncbi:hypothetical protein [Sphingomonas sp. CROZ-RG-20F-R02-07]|uniref:hypothetical protein n=1 Tax=Sphingomonas sp. CROZ-RG-20F-R02-07 TaxID=2914832 RepID=UPI001F58DA82|nr:hypothetical protein [Sphingomonas sp. CROZ-RG-20F-R02-07]
MTATRLRCLLLAGSALACAGTAHAQSTSGTAAGTLVSNTAQASFTVNGTAQTATSNTATFVVDRKVNLTVVASPATNTQVNLGQTGAVLTFKVTNNTNGTQDFILSADQIVSLGVLPGTDNFDATNLKVFVDSNGNGTYDPGTDTATFIDELPEDGTATVFVVGDIPNTAGENLAFVSLRATVATGGTSGTLGAALVPTDLNILNQDNTVDVVFADNDSDGIGPDIARNGQARAYLAYEVGVRSVNLTVVKTAQVLSDGVNAINPKALPGAVVQYCLTVTNSTLLVPANGVALTDVIPANTSYVPGSITVGGIGAGGACLVSGLPVADDGSTTGLYGGSYNTSTKTVTATIPTLAGGTSVAASFRVTIN